MKKVAFAIVPLLFATGIQAQERRPTEADLDAAFKSCMHRNGGFDAAVFAKCQEEDYQARQRFNVPPPVNSQTDAEKAYELAKLRAQERYEIERDSIRRNYDLSKSGLLN